MMWLATLELSGASMRKIPDHGVVIRRPLLARQRHDTITPMSRFIVVLIGAAIGYQMFGVRGALLFGGLSATILLFTRVLARFSRRIAVSTTFALAAAAIYPALTLGWGGGEAADGSRYKASPVGLSHVLTPQQPTSETVDCGWYEASGYVAACAVATDGGTAFTLLKVVYPLAGVACVAAIIAAALAMFSRHSYRRVRIASGITLASMLTGAIIVFASSLTRALAALDGVPVGVGGSLGTMLVSTAVLLSLAIASQAYDEGRSLEPAETTNAGSTISRVHATP
jgi:hypothetical protein